MHCLQSLLSLFVLHTYNDVCIIYAHGISYMELLPPWIPMLTASSSGSDDIEEVYVVLPCNYINITQVSNTWTSAGHYHTR